MATENVPVPLVVYQVKNKAFVVAGTGQATPDEMYSYADFEGLVEHLAVHFGVRWAKRDAVRTAKTEGGVNIR